MNRVKKRIDYWCEDTAKKGVKGRGVGIAVLDTGMAAHPDLSGKITAFRDCVNRRHGMYDDSGHGTHVGGILAGDGRMSKGLYSGIAPEAQLIVVKVLNAKGEGEIEQILEGIEWIRQNGDQLGVRIVNISVGARKDLDNGKEEILVKAVEELWDKGLLVVVSAGNYGPGEGTIAVPGNSRKVITVGAMDELEMKYNCSGEGPTEQCIVKPDLVAPGYQTISCNSYYRKDRRYYIKKSGTSMATPVVSGAAALFLSKYPDAHNVEIKLRLRETCAREKGLKVQGWGRIRIDHFLEDK